MEDQNQSICLHLEPAAAAAGGPSAGSRSSASAGAGCIRSGESAGAVPASGSPRRSCPRRHSRTARLPGYFALLACVGILGVAMAVGMVGNAKVINKSVRCGRTGIYHRMIGPRLELRLSGRRRADSSIFWPPLRKMQYEKSAQPL